MSCLVTWSLGVGLGGPRAPRMLSPRQYPARRAYFHRFLIINTNTSWAANVRV